MCPDWWLTTTQTSRGVWSDTSTTLGPLVTTYASNATGTTRSRWGNGEDVHLWDQTFSSFGEAVRYWERQRACVPTLPPAPRAAAARARAIQARQAREAAEARAEALLGRFLDVAQLYSWIRHGFFDLRVGERLYRLRRGIAGNIDLLMDGTSPRQRTYCAHPDRELPVADIVLTQLLMLRHNEAAFLRIANVR